MHPSYAGALTGVARTVAGVRNVSRTIGRAGGRPGARIGRAHLWATARPSLGGLGDEARAGDDADGGRDSPLGHTGGRGGGARCGTNRP